MNGNETKKELLEKLKQAYQDASKYDEQKNVCEAIQKRLAGNADAKGKTASKNRTIGIVAGIVAGLFVGTIFPYGLYNDILEAGAPLFFTLTPIVSMAIPGIVVGIIVTKSLKKRLGVYDKQEIEIRKEFDAAFQVLQQISDTNKRTHSYIPPKYLNITHIQMLYDILTYGRADNWKEALNVLEQDLHNKRMENEMRHTACVQEQTLKAANEAACLAQQAIDEVRWRN